MNVLRILADVETTDPKSLAVFYKELFGLDVLMDLDWIVTLGGETSAPVQISFASQGGSGTAVPKLSIEVDDLDDALGRAQTMKLDIEYGPVNEPWGVRRFFVRDPAGQLLNVLTHKAS